MTARRSRRRHAQVDVKRLREQVRYRRIPPGSLPVTTTCSAGGLRCPHRRPDQRDFSYLAQWSFRFVMGGFWWQQSLWKLPPLYTNHPEAPLTTGLTYLMPHCRRCPRSGLMRSDDRRGDFEYSWEAIMATEWRIKAVHLGNCNCAYGCP